jgi:hypothetical protein
LPKISNFFFLLPKYVYDLLMYLSQDFRRGPAYRVRSAPDLHPSCRRRDPARAGEICSEFSFPVNVWSRFSFPGNEKKPPASFPTPSSPYEIQPKKAPAPGETKGKSFSVTNDENELLQVVAIQSSSAKKKKKYKQSDQTERDERVEKVFFQENTREARGS